MWVTPKRGKLIVISAPSGCGKTTITMRLLERNSHLVRSVSYTTRPPRKGEENGKDYFFISEAEFLKKKNKGFFLESANVFGCHYGTSRQWVEDVVRSGRDVVLAIDVQGMKQVKYAVSQKSSAFDAIFIFMMPPSLTALKRRLKKRSTETESQMRERLRQAEAEMKQSSFYDFVVVNQKIDQTVKVIERVIQ